MRKLKFLAPLVMAVAVLAGVANPAGAITNTQHYRDINSPPDSCAWTQSVMENHYTVGWGWFESAAGGASWFINDPGCVYGSGDVAPKPVNTIRFQFQIWCSLNGGNTQFLAYTSPLVYNPANVGVANIPTIPEGQYCSVDPAQTVLTHIRVFGGYKIGTTWFNTQHDGAWT